jgi:uncharacterized membrane protein
MRYGCFGPLMLAGIVVALLLATLLVNAASFSFQRLGLTPAEALGLLTASLAGSLINIPIYRRRVVTPGEKWQAFPWLYYRPPALRQQVVAVNAGGALIPLGLAIYLFERSPIVPVVAVTLLVTAASKLLSRVVPGAGVTLPPFIPPLIAAGFALLLARGHAAAVAYIAGVLGTIIGADLLNLPAVLNMPASVLSIGGAGVFDGIFLVGIIAVLIA